jgi:hypothetical protein
MLQMTENTRRCPQRIHRYHTFALRQHFTNSKHQHANSQFTPALLSNLSTLIIVILKGMKHSTAIPITKPTPTSLITTLIVLVRATLIFSRKPPLTRKTIYTTNPIFVSETRKA